MRTSCARSATSPRRAARAPIGRRRSSVARPRAAALEVIADRFPPRVRLADAATRRARPADAPLCPPSASSRRRGEPRGRFRVAVRIPRAFHDRRARRLSQGFSAVSSRREETAGPLLARDESDPLKLNGTRDRPRRATRHRRPDGTDGQEGSLASAPARVPRVEHRWRYVPSIDPRRVAAPTPLPIVSRVAGRASESGATRTRKPRSPFALRPSVVLRGEKGAKIFPPKITGSPPALSRLGPRDFSLNSNRDFRSPLAPLPRAFRGIEEKISRLDFGRAPMTRQLFGRSRCRSGYFPSALPRANRSIIAGTALNRRCRRSPPLSAPPSCRESDKGVKGDGPASIFRIAPTSARTVKELAFSSPSTGVPMRAVVPRRPAL